MIRRILAGGILLAAAGLPAAADAAGGGDWRLEAKGTGEAGYRSNPLYKGANDSLLQGSAYGALGGKIRSRTRHAPFGNASLSLDFSGSAHPSVSEADALRAGVDAEWLPVPDLVFLPGLEYTLDWTDNSVISQTDREDPLTPLVGYVRHVIVAYWEGRAGDFAEWRLAPEWEYKNYTETPGSDHSLDRSVPALTADLRLGRRGPLRFQADYAFRHRYYRRYYSRDEAGRRVTSWDREYRLHEADFELEWKAERFAAALSYAWEKRADLYAGYFSRTTHAPGLKLKADLGGGFSAEAKGWQTHAYYTRYRVGYRTDRPLKRIRYDHLAGNLSWSRGLFAVSLGENFRNEDNNSPGFSNREWETSLGIEYRIGFEPGR